jgi:hypothetical protein
MRLLVPLLFLPFPTLAQPMTASQFDAYVTGKTLTYVVGGVIYGIEQYLPGRKVKWAYTEDECMDGTWYPSGDQICFAYQNDPEPQCWIFEQGLSGLSAIYQNDPAAGEVVETHQTDEPLFCPGPRIGV